MAHQRINQIKIKKIVEENGKKYFRNINPKKDSITEFYKFGEGLFFYFYFLKYYAIVFLIITFISFIPLIFNLSG